MRILKGISPKSACQEVQLRNLICERCGAEYEVTEHAVTMSARDSFKCDCGHTLVRGQAVEVHTFKLIKLGQEPDTMNQRE
jgi:hypothetical protein